MSGGRALARILACGLLAAALLAAAPGGRAAAAPAFLSAVADLPLMPGLVEAPDRTVVFDTPGGRIVLAAAAGAVAEAAVRRYYRAALPGLGWTAVEGARGADRFVRDGEVLVVEYRRGEAGLVVRFSLSPAAPR